MKLRDNYFRDRKHAGHELGLFLNPKYEKFDPLVIGIPRGGVEVAFHVACCLHTQLSLIVSKKLPFPHNKELGFGAIAEENSVYISAMAKEVLPESIINRIIEEQAQEINRRVEKYRHGNPLPEMKDRIVIVVDDGIATGVTLVPVTRLCRKNKASKVIIAAPVSGTPYDKELDEADAIEILVQPLSFYSVGQVYEKFGDFTDREVQNRLREAELIDFRKTGCESN